MRLGLLRTILPACIWLTLLPSTAVGQFALTGASIADGQANVPLVDSVYFNFNQQLPFNTLFTPKFYWEPTGHYQRTEVFLGVDRMNPRFRLVHQQNFDFSVYVFGVQSASGSRMQRPFALNYSTAPTSGSRQVAGTVQFSTRTPPNTSAIAELIYRQHVDQLARKQQEAREAAPNGRVQSEIEPDGVKSRRIRADRPTLSLQSGQAANLNYTVILLLDQFAIDEMEWSPRAVAAVTASGTYNFAHVRNGTYFPVAFNFTNDTGETIGHYGYYDPDGDFTPNAVTVNNGNVSGVQLKLYSYGVSQALPYRILAEAEAEGVAADAKLINMNAATALNGTALEWTYRFRSVQLNRDIIVAVDPLTISSSISTSSYTQPTTSLPRTGLIDSGTALTVAEQNGGSAYRSANPGPLTITAVGGNQLSAFPSAPTHLLWKVQYAAVGSPSPPFVIYIDMLTGLPFEDLPVELTDFRATVNGTDVTLAWTTQSETNNAGFEIEQTPAGSEAWSTVTFVPARGASNRVEQYRHTLLQLRPGRYAFRLKQIDLDGTASYSASVEAAVTVGAPIFLGAVYPNPLSSVGTIEFGSSTAGSATVVLYDLLGREIQTLFDGSTDSERLEKLVIDGTVLQNGVYFIDARVGSNRRVQRVVVAH